MNFQKLKVVYLQHIYVFTVAFESLNLINLVQIHLILSHGISAFQHPLLTFIVIDGLKDWFGMPIGLNMRGQTVCLILLKYLFSCQDLLYLLVNFVFIVSVEYALHGLKLVIDDQEISSQVIVLITSFVQNSDIPLQKIKPLKSKQSHV